MDMYAPITITSRVELFTRKNSDLLNRAFQKVIDPFKNPVRSALNVTSSAAKSTAPSISSENGYHHTTVNGLHKINGTANRKKIRALHIEDDEEIRFLVKAFLKSFMDVDSAADGHEAIAVSSEKKYDLIITDINLGTGIDGIEATREIRNMAHYHNIPVIAATANAGSDIRNQCIEVGMDAFLLKPFMKNDLISTIKKVMSI